jgi:saccharopine dehydrogenase-like NADP-dependent oxidoreductase
MLDRYDEKNGISSMSRTTGYPIAVLSLLVAKGEIAQKGVVPLEVLGMDGKISKLILEELQRRSIQIDEKITG